MGADNRVAAPDARKASRVMPLGLLRLPLATEWSGAAGIRHVLRDHRCALRSEITHALPEPGPHERAGRVGIGRRHHRSDLLPLAPALLAPTLRKPLAPQVFLSATRPSGRHRYLLCDPDRSFIVLHTLNRLGRFILRLKVSSIACESMPLRVPDNFYYRKLLS